MADESISKVHLRYLRVAPRKVRLLADAVRGKPVSDALNVLQFARKSAARDLYKLIRSAVANVNKKGGVDVDKLFVRTICVDQGPTLRRFMTRARGMANRINKKTSHVTLELSVR